jgi:hypothetical protein
MYGVVLKFGPPSYGDLFMLIGDFRAIRLTSANGEALSRAVAPQVGERQLCPTHSRNLPGGNRPPSDPVLRAAKDRSGRQTGPD